jgi:hypothetical protein
MNFIPLQFICMGTRTQPRTNVKYSGRPSSINVDWYSKVQQVARIALPSSAECIPAESARLRALSARVRWDMADSLSSDD